VVTYHKGSGNVVRIVADYNIYGIMVRNGGKIISLGSAKDQGDIVLKEVMRTAELMKINRAMDIVKYGFIRGDGFLDIGYYWLLGALTQLVNTATNMMLDKGAQYNMGGGFLAKEFRKGNNSGAVSFKMGEYKQTDIPASVLQGGIVNLPVGEPSQILLQLLTMAQGELANFSASVDLSALIAQNVAPTTAAISVSEQLVPTAAIYQYIQVLDNYNSAVREGEIGLLSGASSIREKVETAIKKLDKGQVVNKSVVLDITKGMETLIKSINDAAKNKESQFMAQANTAGVGDLWTDYRGQFQTNYQGGSTFSSGGKTFNLPN